jgi:putative hemolysin
MFGGTSLGRLILALAMSLLLAACERPSEPPSAVVPQDDVQPFTGTWSATGTRQTLQLAAGHRRRRSSR